MPSIAYLECVRCGNHVSAATPQTLCPLDAGVLYVRYDMEALQKSARRERPAPVARAFDAGKAASEFFQGAATFASGLRVPKPYGDSIILEIVRASGGSVVATDDASILASVRDWAKEEGIFLSPEGAAATAAYDTLRASGAIQPGERVVLFNTGAGLKYTDMVAEAMGLRRP